MKYFLNGSTYKENMYNTVYFSNLTFIVSIYIVLHITNALYLPNLCYPVHTGQESSQSKCDENIAATAVALVILLLLKLMPH